VCRWANACSVNSVARIADRHAAAPAITLRLPKEGELKTVDVQGIPIAYTVRGSGRPVLLVHGWQGDHRYMVADVDAVFEAAGGWRRIYLDLPGHGQTPAPAALRSQGQVVSLLTDVVDTLVPGQPCAVAGSSYGGYLTLGLVRSMPERLLGAALLVPDLPAPDGTRAAPAHVTIRRDPAAFTDLSADEEWIPDRLVEQSRRGLELIREHDMPAMRIADHAFLERLAADYQLPAELLNPGPPFDRPSVILTGRQDALAGYESAWSLLPEFPRATFATLDLAGHWLGRVERPAPFRALLADWIERMSIGASGSDAADDVP
jgi:pimeloyl-ACP methyl ester carboxylesterase